MEDTEKSKCQLKKEAKRLEKLAKFNAKKEKFSSQPTEKVRSFPI